MEGDKLILFGSGQLAQMLIENFSNVKYKYIIDNDNLKWGKEFCNLTIYSPEKIHSEEKNEIKIVVGSSFYDEIKTQLENEFSLVEGIDFIPPEIFIAENSASIDQDIVGKSTKVINFSITNKCNFRCAMCNIWRPEYSKYKDMTPLELRQLFSQELFEELSHVGISGGEPFVRKDLEEAIEAIVDSVKSLKSISIITNCSIINTPLRIQNIKKFLDSKNVKLTIQVSVDGIGEIHNINRGRKNAFSDMYSNLIQLIQKGLVNEISTTITKFNINYLWDNYYFAKKNNIYIRFRLATSIDRLYNHDLKDNFSFTEKEKLILIKFFENIINNYEKDINKKIHYYSLINQLNGGGRLSGCTFQTSEGLSLDPYGNLHFCFPKSELIGNINNEDKYGIDYLKSNKHILEDTRKNCENCVHDYTGSFTQKGIEYYYKIIHREKNRKKSNDVFLMDYINGK